MKLNIGVLCCLFAGCGTDPEGLGILNIGATTPIKGITALVITVEARATVASSMAPLKAPIDIPPTVRAGVYVPPQLSGVTKFRVVAMDATSQVLGMGNVEGLIRSGEKIELGILLTPGALMCQGGLAACGAACVNLVTDPANCGKCGNSCMATDTCVSGVCQLVCSAGLTPCASACVNTMTDGANCGACGKACAMGQVCLAGVCGTDCGALSKCGSSCVDLGSDAQNCNGCGKACTIPPNASAVCTAGACGIGACKQGYGNCDGNAGNGCEVNVFTDVNNCGACGMVCPVPGHGSPVCNGSGACAIGVCDVGYADCDKQIANGCEVDLAADNANCGACGTVCGGGKICLLSSCVTPPPPPDLGVSMDMTVIPDMAMPDLATVDLTTAPDMACTPGIYLLNCGGPSTCRCPKGTRCKVTPDCEPGLTCKAGGIDFECQ